MADGRRPVRERFGLSLLIFLHVVLCCVTLACVAQIYPEFHIFYRPDGLPGAVAVVAAFSVVAALFVFAEFSFGYFVGFYIYTMVLGYLWLNRFSEFNYNHQLAGLSAAASGVAFLLPALFIRSPLPQLWTLSPTALNRLVNVILLLGAVTVAIGASYNFRLVGISDIYEFRDALKAPAILNYLTSTLSGALLPFAFACFVERRDIWRGGAALFLLVSFYPIVLSKLALLTPVWLVLMVLLSRIFELRITVIVSLLVPMAIGLILFILFRSGLASHEMTIPYFGLVNLRMIAIPPLAMDYYNEFFSRHDLTYFCQIRPLKLLLSCPYQDQLSIVIYNAFEVGGNFNASLFATEGIASVGPMFAPVAVFACGLVIALGNRSSAGLPPRFVLVSGAVLVQVLPNVPFSVALFTHGSLILFLLWYVMPRPRGTAA
jgi:hypothetical protein